MKNMHIINDINNKEIIKIKNTKKDQNIYSDKNSVKNDIDKHKTNYQSNGLEEKL